MKTLTNPSCRVSFDSYCRERGSSSSCSSLIETCFLRPWVKVSGFGFLNFNNVKLSNTFIDPVSCISPKNQVDLEAENVQAKGRYQSKTARVIFKLQKECMFGEHFFIVGDDPIFGLWDPESAIPLNWSDGHAWIVELDIPIGKSIHFKFILKDSNGEVLWQPGPDRVFQTWETKNAITVYEDWENTELQIVAEEDEVSIQNADENLTHPQEELVSDVYNEPTITNNDVTTQEKPLVEPREEQIVLNNIPSPEEKPIQAIVEDSTSYTDNDSLEKKFAAISNNNVVIGEEVLGNNGRVTTSKNMESTNIDNILVNYEGEPVLVPGLTQTPPEPTEEVSQDEVENTLSVDKPVEAAFEAKDHNLPETQLDEEKELHKHSYPFETGTPSSKMTDEEEEVKTVENQLQQKPVITELEEEYDSDVEDVNVLNNDLQWGRKTLEKFLTNFGLF
ncbi:uncharacterized protein LOC115697742 isoform X1 [Cannabis sativa]|uniref:uncharacterized protein LOC115697742 isoform X1 n=1 Tax=Cannabis sativa TaxID=3483 RepID=UPI0011DF989B|nr:uncharacterized protein LOC115697742 isoform X1 [Cannabis sativa]